ncbi:MAG: hypothetical protein K2L83_09455, partial [Muribaculaceae bacterium]|nr:hypothetical protein [Muribaculaceae bacterium]
MKTRILVIALSVILSAGVAMAQNSAPAPGSGGSFQPNIGGPGPGMMDPGWGGPWGGGWQASPPIVVNITPYSPGWSNSGTTSVVGVGYDAQGIWRAIPMNVAYTYVGGQYNVTVL